MNSNGLKFWIAWKFGLQRTEEQVISLDQQVTTWKPILERIRVYFLKDDSVSSG